MLNSMKTRFHISSTSGTSWLTRWLASRPPMRSKCISEHGPHGPVSPIIQKLSFIPNGKMRSDGILPNNISSVYNAWWQFTLLQMLTRLKYIQQKHTKASNKRTQNTDTTLCACFLRRLICYASIQTWEKYCSIINTQDSSRCLLLPDLLQVLFLGNRQNK